MEFPHIGKNCSFKTCNKLDFLPMKCNACREVYCAEHFAYVSHECAEAARGDVQVPACPLCGVPVPGARGQPPDLAVGAHIDSQCTSDPATERRLKVFTNRCLYKGCKTKEMVRLECGQCSLNFCLRHRHAADHACQGRLVTKRRQAHDAAMARIKASEGARLAVATEPVVSNEAFTRVQGTMSEDEALAHALALSLQEQPPTQQSALQERDNHFARALARQRVGGDQNSRCTVS